MANKEIIKSVKTGNIVTSLQELENGDSFVVKGDEVSEAGKIVLNNTANTFGTTLTSGNVSSNLTFTLPDNDGTVGQVIKTDGSGNLTFANDNNTTVLTDDSSPQLGGNLDVNGQSIVSVSNGDISLLPDGTGTVLIDGDGTTGGITLESGSIDVKNSGAVSNMKLYCESGNSHYTQIQSAADVDYSSNVSLTLPTTTGTLAIAADAGGSSGISEFVATGTIATGDIVGLRSDGTVEVIADGTTTQTESFGTPVVFESAQSLNISATFDSSQNKIVIAYRDSGNSNYGTAVVGTVSETSISFGTPVVFESAQSNNISVTFDSSQNKVVIAYQDAVNSGYGTAVVGTVSGTSISFGTPVVFESAQTSKISATFDSSQNKVVIAYSDDGILGHGTAVVGTVSGTSISFGTPVVFESANTDYISATFDSSQNKVVIAYRDVGNSNYGTAIVGTVSGTSISFGTPVVFESAQSLYISATFDSSQNKVVIAYSDDGNSGYGTAVVGTVSGTSISFGSPAVFEGAITQFISATFDSSQNKIVIAYRDAGNLYYGTAVVGTVSGTSISFGTPVVFNSAQSNYISATFDSNTNEVVIAYQDGGNSNYGTAVVYTPPGTIPTTNAASWIGIAKENISNTATGKINIKCAIDTNQTGLTPGTSYFVNYDGTLTATENAGPVTGTYGKIGRALSSTELLITRSN